MTIPTIGAELQDSAKPVNAKTKIWMETQNGKILPRALALASLLFSLIACAGNASTLTVTNTADIGSVSSRAEE